MAISEMKGQGWKAIPTSEGRQAIY